MKNEVNKTYYTAFGSFSFLVLSLCSSSVGQMLPFTLPQSLLVSLHVYTSYDT